MTVFKTWIAALAMGLCSAGIAAADEAAQVMDLGADSYRAGSTVTLDAQGRDDVFLAGQKVRVAAELTGSAHLAGRWVDVDAPVAGDIYGLGQKITLGAPVAGDVSAAAQRVHLEAEVSGDVRLVGSEITIDAPVAGNAIVTGESIDFNAAIAGDVVLTSHDVRFGPDAAIGGTLIIYEEVEGTVAVPEAVIAADLIERRGRAVNAYAPDLFGYTAGDERVAAGLPAKDPKPEPLPKRFLSGVLIMGILGALLAVIWPETVAAMRRDVLRRPIRAFVAGFVGLSALIGAVVLLALTVVGLVATPLVVLAAALLWALGYVVATYAAGVWTMSWFGGGEPISNGERAMAAGIGALGVGLLGLVPVVGWLLLMILPLLGAGAVVLRFLRPQLFVAA